MTNHIPLLLRAALAVTEAGFFEVINRGVKAEEERWGGILHISDPAVYVSIVTPSLAEVLLGRVEDPAKLLKYKRLANEKSHRLMRFPNHDSSWESRDESKRMFAGAIRAQSFLLSFSGLPELADEALVLCVATIAEVMHHQTAARIATMSGSIRFYEAFLVHVGIEKLRQEVRNLCSRED